MTQIDNPYCGYLVLIFAKLEKFRFFLGVSKKVFDLFKIHNETSFSLFRRGYFFCGWQNLQNFARMNFGR